MPNWGQILHEIGDFRTAHQNKSRSAVDLTRRKYLKKLHQYTGRNVIAYYSGFLSKPDLAGVDIVDEDKNGFMMAVHQIDKSLGLDLLLHTPGGSIAAAETILDYLNRMFGNDIRVVVPQIAMSAGTMLACASKQIVMGKHSNLGPIDPHLNGIPAAGVKDEFTNALAEMKADPAAVNAWRFILGQYTPTFLKQCELSVTWAKTFVTDALVKNMLSGDPKAAQKAGAIVDILSDFSGNRAHDRHIHIDECIQMGLNIYQLESDSKLQDLILTVHHCFMHTLMNTGAFKLIENHNGVAFVKSIRAVEVQAP